MWYIYDFSRISAVFQLWELVLLFFSQVLLNIYLRDEVITSIYKPAVVPGSAVLCVMFIISASRPVSGYAKVGQDCSKSLYTVFSTFQSTAAEIK